MHVDWERVAQLAIAHQVTPLLDRAWHGFPEVPAGLVAEVKSVRRQLGLRAALAVRQRDEILGLFEAEGIRSLVLKGGALARTWYGDLSLRPFTDLDFLVPPADVARAQTILRRIGYADVAHPGAGHHVIPLGRRDVPCALELHHTLTGLTLPLSFSFEELDSRAVTLGQADAGVRTLDPEDTLLHLCVHLLFHVNHDQGWQLRQLSDIARHLEAFAVDWTVFGERAKRHGADRVARALLDLAMVVAGAPVPASQRDESLRHELLRQSVPGKTDHLLLAAFLAVLLRGKVSQATNLLLQATAGWSRERPPALRDMRPGLLLKHVQKVAWEGVREPRRLSHQLALWMPEWKRRGKRRRLLTELLPQPNGHV